MYIIIYKVINMCILLIQLMSIKYLQFLLTINFPNSLKLTYYNSNYYLQNYGTKMSRNLQTTVLKPVHYIDKITFK